MRVDQEPGDLRQRGFRRTLFAVKHQRRIGTGRSNGRGEPGDEETEISSPRLTYGLSRLIVPPDSGTGSGNIPVGRRK